METILRSKSILSGESDLEKLIYFPNFPVFIGATDQAPEKDVFADMEWDICKKTGCIQLKNLLPLNIIYNEFHSEALGSTWEIHHKKFANFICENTTNDILEIGGSDGKLAEKVCNEFNSYKWTIVEPNADKKFNNKNIELIEEFFSDKLKIKKGRDIVHSHVFEHMYDPNEFLRNTYEYLDYGNKQIFSIPNLKKYLDQKFSNVINFEHTFYFNEEMLEFLFNSHGFKITKKEYFEQHSIFVIAEKIRGFKNNKQINFYEENKASYLSMINFYKDQVFALNNIIDNNHNTVFTFGAHIFSQFLIYLGLKTEKINSILDNSALKTGKRLYGTNLRINLPNKIKKYENPTVIVFAGQYQNEIETQLLKINPTVKIISPSSLI